MNIQAIPYIFPLVAAGIISLILGFYVWKQEKTLRGAMFTLLMLFLSLWSFIYALQLASAGENAILFWYKVKYIAIAIVPAAWCSFTLIYAERERWTILRNLFLLFVTPIINIGFVLTNDWHHLFWTEKTVGEAEVISVISSTNGPLFWVHTAYSYMMVLIGVFLIFKMLFSSRHLYLKQALLLGIGVVTPFIGNIIIVWNLIPFKFGYDITPLLFTVTGISFTVAIFKYRFFTIIPIARDKIVENIQDAIFVLDKGNRIIDVNHNGKQLVVEKYFPYPTVDVVGIQAEEVLYKISSFKWFHSAYEVAGEIELLGNQGEKYFDTRITPIYDKKNAIKGRLVTLRDVTEKKEAKEKLKETSERLELAMDAGEHGFWDWNLDTDDVYFSPRYYTMLGYEPGELPMRLETWVDLMHPEDKKIIVPRVQKYVENAEPYEVEFRLKCKDGSWKWISGRGKMFDKDEKGVPHRAVGVHVDITEHKMAEEKLKEAHELLKTLNADLERKVQDRTVEVEKLLKQKDEFVNQLGHDLKNPLGPLINLIPVLEKDETDLERKKIFDVLNRNTNHMKNLVVKTIQLAKLNSTTTKLSFEDTNLLGEIDDVIEKGKLLFEENNIEIENKTSEDIMVKADKLRLTELFDNLIGNSVKYSLDGGKITIDAKEEKDFVTVSIKDAGMGITEEQLSHIFDEFYKADWSRHDFDSSGLGLPICKRIVEKHGGKIWAESEGEGKGTTMFFTLPISSEKQQDKEQQ